MLSDTTERLFAFVETAEAFEGEGGPLTYVRLEALPAVQVVSKGSALRPFGEDLERMTPMVLDFTLDPRDQTDVFAVPPEEDNWLELELGSSGVRAMRYSGPLGEAPVGEEVHIRSARPFPNKMRRELIRTFTPSADGHDERMRAWLKSQRERMRGRVFGRVVSVLEVGQGNAVLISDAGGQPLAYFDFGGGCYGNSATYPRPRNFAFNEHTSIILSHWDADHWFSAHLVPEALNCQWIAPLQKMGPAAARLAGTLLKKGALTFVPPRIRRLMTPFGDVIQCTGKSRNDSGIALLAKIGGRTRRSLIRILLPGDAAYNRIPDLPGDIDGLVASHHGARTVGKAPLRKGAGRIAYSFGTPNRYRHPSGSQQADDAEAGWRF